MLDATVSKIKIKHDGFSKIAGAIDTEMKQNLQKS
jgi:hypothetical protein